MDGFSWGGWHGGRSRTGARAEADERSEALEWAGGRLREGVGVNGDSVVRLGGLGKSGRRGGCRRQMDEDRSVSEVRKIYGEVFG